jgi:hypothetical protein
MTSYVVQQHTGQYSDTTWKSLLKVRAIPHRQLSLAIANLHASHTLKWKVLVSNSLHGDADTWAEEKSEDTINGASTILPVRYVLSGPFVWVDVQIESVGADQSPQGSAWLLACSL